MGEAIKLTILTPEKQFFKGEVTSVKTEGIDGGFEVLSNHMSMVSILGPGVTEFTDKDNKEYKAFTSDGVLKVHNNEISILCESCEWPEEIDVNRAEAALNRAKKRLESKDNIDVLRAELALQKSVARLKLK
ncbi:F0F1 ATP synthase subunit epsilon [Clostridium sp. 19966]|uniref:F0F1 ATP synthase subunit epsilon n=1 Tax=Clostridium sp. 19966 TaxID=2768166 RepID=UPI0028DFC037|nr:F0F1 ATP synthase subunit epsilon [Clostridium sp. 19966]MDT8715583.1 F0F1 ATP synthase subunit epsilon [Clostridium sp. 19966]